MRARFLLQVGMIVLLAMGLTMCRQPAEQPAETPAETPATDAPPVEETGTPETIAEQVRDLQRRLKTTRRHVRDGVRQEGSLGLSEIARVFSENAAASSGSVKENLEFSASEFAGMSERVFDTPTVTREEMDAALTRAFWALAAYHQIRAAAQWEGGARALTAAHLNATATYIDEAIGYLAGGFEVQLESLVEQIRDLARQLKAGASSNSEAVAALIQNFGQQMEEYSRQVRERIA